MPTILRWFHDDGVRYRAYFRYSPDAAHRELVVASTEWQTTTADDRARLEEYSEEELIGLTRYLRAHSQQEQQPPAIDPTRVIR